MKELSIEKKAKRYDNVMTQGVDPLITRADVQDFFPELFESEDEKMELLEHLKSCLSTSSTTIWKKKYQRWIAWLEKQGNKVVNEELSKLLNKVICRFINDPNIPYSERDEVSKKIVPYVEHLEKVGEQKPADKVEPKFKVGDWIIGRATNNKPRQISEITDQYYKSTYGGQYGFSFEDGMHLWTIQDAKYGDLLSDDYGIYIFDRFDEYDEKCFHCMGAYQRYQKVYENEHMLCSVKVHPATKEQRDLLFQKMHESGYEWDADKKESKKIEQKPQSTWKPSDEQMEALEKECFAHSNYDLCRLLEDLKKLK